MAQLSDDCFAFGGPMMSVDEAVAMIASRVRAVHDVEAVSLAAADGRVLAEAIVASMPLPPFTNSAVDGYAVRSEDLLTRRQAGVSGCGAYRGRELSPKTPSSLRKPCASSPGRQCPAGADTVFMQEDVKVEDGQVFLPRRAESWCQRAADRRRYFRRCVGAAVRDALCGLRTLH